MKHARHPQSAFALVATLAILSIVAILVVAYSTTARTESNASQNFAERERAQAIGQGMLNRILADHAQPELSPGKRLKPFAVVAATKLPTTETDSTYNAALPLPGIYRMEPMAGLRTDNHLVRISKPKSGEGETAFTPPAWAWARQELRPNDPESAERIALFTPQDSSGKAIAPQWVDYVEVENDGQASATAGQAVPIGEVAYCIWDESGNIDINVAGKDPNVNGVAPHNLGLEKLTTDPAGFLSLLDGRDGKRQRSNFALREISKKATNDTGDDRWFFSVEEMLARRLLTPQNALNVTSSSRDFDVRPEWDGDRSYVNAQKFLRSYINNPELFRLFGDGVYPPYRNASSRLVTPTFNEQTLKGKLATEGFPQTEDWMQVMRLLAALRLSLPPFTTLPSPASNTPLQMNRWTDDDVYGIALNILQATAPASDQNLHAYDRKNHGVAPFGDPNVRVGIRVSPYITEIAMVAERINDTQVRLKAYYEVWNPYDVPLVKPNGQPIKYFFGNWTGPTMPDAPAGVTPTGGIYNMEKRWELPNPAAKPMKIGTWSGVVSPPGPRQFVVISPYDEPDGRVITFPKAETRNLEVRTRPYLQNQDYWTTHRWGTGAGLEESSSYAVTIGPFYAAGQDPNANLIHVFEAAKLNRKDPTQPNNANAYTPVWHSFQIDDPRMGPYSRYTSDYKLNPTPPANAGAESFQRYSWIAYREKHSLFNFPDSPRTPDSEKFVSSYGDGFNENFGANWPPGFDFNRAMATFALPRRPFLNVGELGTVFANRPWRTLSFAMTTVPSSPTTTTVSAANATTIQAGTKAQNYPSALLDYLTTVGSTTEKTTLNYKAPAGEPPSSLVAATLKERTQDMIWLFESVDNKGIPNGNIRPIRGKINLNSASRDTIKLLLSAPYRLPRSWGLVEWMKLNPPQIPPPVSDSDIEVTVKPEDADLIAAEIVDESVPAKKIRPIRTMADLGKLTSIKKLHERYPDPVVDAMIGRLAQFGTVRQQIYTVDMVARSLNKKVEERRLSDPKIPRVVTAEVRFLARIYFDTFSRKGFVESIEYR
jgi:hypothetical protein